MIERHDECDLHMPLWMSWINWMTSSLDIHFIIIPLTPHRNRISSIRWYCLNLHAICSTSTLSSDGGWFYRNILIGCIQSYDGSYSSSSITIRSCLIASLVDSAGLTEGLANFSIMMYSGVGTLEEAIYARWSASRLSSRGTYQTSNHLKISPFFTLLLDTHSSSHYCSHTLFVLTLLPVVNHP
jgi:hypothetical protein